jgi:hypothetical protein
LKINMLLDAVQARPKAASRHGLQAPGKKCRGGLGAAAIIAPVAPCL